MLAGRKNFDKDEKTKFPWFLLGDRKKSLREYTCGGP